MTARKFSGALAAIAVAVTVAGCAAGTTRASTATPKAPGPTWTVATACPASSDMGTAASTTSAAAAAPLIRRGAVSAVICQYVASPSKKTAGMLRHVTLGAAAADGLAALFDDAGRVASPPRCTGFAFSQIVIFGYESGSAVTASVHFGACSAYSGVVTAGGHAAVFGAPLGPALNAYSVLGLLGPGPLIPDVTGLSPAAASAAAKQHGLTLFVDGAQLDASVPAGTVIFQSPPPVADNPGPGSQLEVIVATAHASACAPAQLALTYRGGGLGAGNDFGSILFRDTGAGSCTLAGMVSATGLNAAGIPVTATVTSAFAGPGALSPNAAPVPDGSGPAPGELVYAWTFQAEYRDGPASVDNGYCQPDWVIPAAWRIALPGGAAVTVPNADPGNLYGGEGQSKGGLITCLGRLGVAAPPAYLSS
jgi:hypothetical protein